MIFLEIIRKINRLLKTNELTLKYQLQIPPCINLPYIIFTISYGNFSSTNVR